ncbi:uncharacterized protein TM35_000132320 [Trypanosoma theileri]|uniref:Exocyst complex component Sec10-like alpha-helical bundle domain-containing protein n=1 Tax=Trypanosoma theileri TaxID=67003 RepID=A0A1X0NXG9_9TRYP|nr:uncharacterized protein TM35_000132320 [Trypanosoma theileri]ORC89228.1 hypothetical protein TM35_000132320 [Trypanosoma theileri]
MSSTAAGGGVKRTVLRRGGDKTASATAAITNKKNDNNNNNNINNININNNSNDTNKSKKHDNSGDTGASGTVARTNKRPHSSQHQQQKQNQETQRPPLDRMVFTSIHFSAPTFTNNITNRVLFPILSAQRKNIPSPSTTTTSPSGTPGRGSNTTNTTNTNTANSNSLTTTTTTIQTGGVDMYGAPVDYTAVARRLTVTLEEALADIAQMRAVEERTLQLNEVRCRRVEIREKRQLATIRLGLEATTARLHEYENRVCNALAATAGIEQHLSQSNARVLRGRSVSQLLKHFKMLTQMNFGELSAVLKNLSKARVEQRVFVTSQWEAGFVSPSDPMYFGGVNSNNAQTNSNNDNNAAGADDERGDDDGGSDDEHHRKSNKHDNTSFGEQQGEKNNEGGRTRGPFLRGGPRQLRRRVVSILETDEGTSELPINTNNTAGGGRTTTTGGSGERNDNSENNTSTTSTSGGAGREKMHRLETAAVAAGLDRAFAIRSCTEAQVEWCQRLSHLRNELDGIVRNTANIELYADWLRQELVADIFHLVECFNELYKDHPDTAVHQVYGRSILKTLELISRLYATITSSHDALLSVFYSRAINQMGVTLFSEYSLKPLPTQPPLGSSTGNTGSAASYTPTAMQHYRTTTEPDLQRTFDFLISRARRDVIIVETIFGTTNSARQQLLAQMTEGVVKPFVTQQLKLVEFFERDILEAEVHLSPRSKRRATPRVVDAISYSHNMQVRLFSFFQSYVDELRGIFDAGEADFLNKYVDSIFSSRAAFVEERAELELLRRYHALLEEQYTRDLHPIPDEVFDLREAHMRKTKELIERLTEVVTRTRNYAPAKDVAACILDLVKESLQNMGHYLEEELRKTIDSIRADRVNWRIKPKSEEELLRPTKLESQQCGLRMLLFVQSSLMSLNDAITVGTLTFMQTDTRLTTAIEEAKESAFETLDEHAETLLNLCANAIIVRSLSILLHYQNRNDYMPKVAKGGEGEMIAQPCTRACTLFCLYITRQFEEAKEFIRLSNGQIQHRQTASQVASGATLEHVMANNKLQGPSNTGVHNRTSSHTEGMDVISDAVRARARTMNMQQLLYGDGGPSSFVRTVGVCLYRGIVTHLKSFTVNDRGALIYKQDVTAYMEAMGPIIHTPGLGGAVVEVLFRMLKETASLLLMSWDHIKGVRETGLLRLMSSEEKVQFIKMREDLRDGFRRMSQ